MENKTSKQVIVFGEGQLASLAHFYFTHDSIHDVVAFTVDKKYMTENTFEGKPLVAFEEVNEKYPPADYEMFLPISFKSMNHLREDKFRSAKEMGYTCVSYVSSKATTWPDLNIGENCFIFEDNTIQPYVTIGDNCVIWSGNHIGHHTVIGDHVFITSHVVISGACEIMDNVFLGVNSTIRDETVLAKETLIGMGAIITKDTNPQSIHLGAKSKELEKKSIELDSLSHKSNG